MMEIDEIKRLYEALDKLTSSIPELKEIWNQYLLKEYKDYPELHYRTPFEDMSQIPDYIVSKERQGDTSEFSNFFDRLEEIFDRHDDTISSYIELGIIEDGFLSYIQDYSRRFDEWLRPKTIERWHKVLNYVSKQAWRENLNP